MNTDEILTLLRQGEQVECVCESLGEVIKVASAVLDDTTVLPSKKLNLMVRFGKRQQ